MKYKLRILLLILIFFNIFVLVFVPAYLSTTHEGGDEGVNGKIIYWSDGSIEITLFTGNKIVKRHEFVHLYQIKDNRLTNEYLDEMEAYTMSLLPDFVFYKIYDKGYEDNVTIKYGYLENEN